MSTDICSFPIDILITIFQFLDPLEFIKSCSTINKYFYSFSRNNYLWLNYRDNFREKNICFPIDFAILYMKDLNKNNNKKSNKNSDESLGEFSAQRKASCNSAVGEKFCIEDSTSFRTKFLCFPFLFFLRKNL